MDDQNKSLNERPPERLEERWGGPARVPERGYVEGGEHTAEIRTDIEQTRADMTETIDAIQEKLRPGNIVSQATDTVRNATTEKVKDMTRSATEAFRGHAPFSSGVMDRIRDNPIPAAVAAASLVWIAFGGRGARRGTRPAIDGPTHATSTAQNGLQRLVRENPLAAAAIAAVVGATVGMALPETRRENQLMGETRDAVVNKAQEAARDAAERVQDAAQRVQDAAAEAERKVTGAD
jgi:ElaB/YqjD/DUF883 family membrane-anchored ribosome-binding protein